MNPPDNDVTIECNDGGASDADIVDYLMNLTFSSPGCEPMNSIANDYSTPADFECGDIITVTIDVEDGCGNTETFLIDFEIEDTQDPIFTSTNFDINIPCGGTGNLTDITDHIDFVVANVTAFDECTSEADLINSIVNDWDGSPFVSCDDDKTITFTIVDCAGNSEDLEVDLNLVDVEDPFIINEATDLFLTCDPANNPDEIQDWLDLFGNATWGDVCTIDPALFTITDDYDGTPPECDPNGPGSETVTFTIEDECGNTVETQAVITIEDIDPPTIDVINSVIVEECNGEEIQNGLVDDIVQNQVIAAASASDVNDCTAPGDLVWMYQPNPAPISATVPNPDCFGIMAGDYIIDVWVEDECGNTSGLTTVTITFDDTLPPDAPNSLPPDEFYECIDDVPPPENIGFFDQCEAFQAVVQETVIEDGCLTTIERFWVFEDACGNPANPGDYTQVITVEDSQAPEWLGNEDDYLPEDIEIIVPNCDEGYTFPNGVFENESEGDIWEPFPLQEGNQFSDNCADPIFYTIGPPPTEQFEGGETVITYVVEDVCGNSLTHEFTVNIICSNCEGGGVVCNNSCETMTGGCHTCNIEELLDGFASCTPEWEGGVEAWPSDLCPAASPGFVPNNMSWFSFVAGGTELCVTVEVGECAIASGGGMQTGMYTACEDDDGECLGGEVDCGGGSTNEISFSVSDLTVGNIYYIFVDGCGGAECDYEIVVEKGFEFILDTPEEVVVESNCEQSALLPPNTYCPESELQFDIWHAGDSPSDQGAFDSPGPYDPELEAEFFWEFNPPIEGMTDGSWTTGEDGDGFAIPPLTFSDVTTETEFEICLTEIVAECSDVECDDCCTTITIAPLPDEAYGPYDVCVEDLLDFGGWDPGQVGDDPNGDGIEWLGPFDITLDQVEQAIAMNMGILEFDVVDPECNCPFTQTVQINPVGNLEPVEVTLFMYDCQFRDEDGDLGPYDWVWPEDTYELFVEYEEQFINIVEGSEVRDWDRERCDSLLLVTVDTAIVTGVITQGPCTPQGTEYSFELLLEQLYDEHDDHPNITPDYMDMQWVDANGMTQATGQTINITPALAMNGPFTVVLDYSFIDGAYGEAQAILTECGKEFGPFELDTGVALPPVVQGDTEFCENDLTGRMFNVLNPVPGSTYEWTFPAGATGNCLECTVERYGRSGFHEL